MKRSSRFVFTLTVLVIAVIVFIAYISRSPSEEGSVSSSLVISEVMSSNKGSVIDPEGNYPDWIELHNDSSEELNIGGLGLSDDITDGVKYVFPSGTKLQADGYIVVWCTGEATGELYAPFKISSGESVVLFGATGNTLDTLILTGVSDGCSYALDASGAWGEAKPSPGYPNDAEGIAAYEASTVSVESPGVFINEFMPSNSTVLADSAGDYPDWIELYNANDFELDLSGYGISDNLSQPKKYTLPEGTVIPAKGYLLLYCTGGEGLAETGELQLPFALAAYGEDVVLSSKSGGIIDSYTYSNAERDMSFARATDGAGNFAATAQATPGYENSAEGYAAFSEANALPKGSVMLSEFTGNNLTLLSSSDGAYYDLIELHNAGDEPASLSGYALSDNPANPARWLFPEVTIEAGGYLVVYASGLDKYENGELHTNFSVNADGESVYLFNPAGLLVDKLQSGAFMGDVSCGRNASMALAYFDPPSFGSANGEGYAGITAVPEFTLTPGVYSSPVEITLSAPAGETVYYTLDCTTPNASSAVYSGPIAADKNTVVRAVSMRDGYITNLTASATYLFTTDGVNHSLKIATLVTDPDNLWSDATGIYAYGEKYDPDLAYGDSLNTAQFYLSKKDEDAWEREASFSVYGEDNTVAFTQNVGIRIAGSFGRGRAQKGFNIFARDEYGSDRMEYPFFEGLPYTEYKSLVLRAGAQDANHGKFRDELATGLLAGTDVNFLYQAYEPYVLYLNGEYWGVYFLKEKRNRFFVAQHEGTENNVDLDIIRSESYANYGSTEEWKTLMAYVRANGAASAEAYSYLSERIDLDSFMDYMICEIYSANSDVWNIQICKVDGGKWKWIYYDFCWSYGATENGYNHKTVSIRRLSSKPCSDLFNALLENSDWRDRFLRRFAELLKTVYAPERVLAKIDELYAECEPEIAREREKFCSDTWLGVPLHAECKGTYEGFVSQVGVMREFAENRPAALKEQLKSEFGLSDAYMQEVFS